MKRIRYLLLFLGLVTIFCGCRKQEESVSTVTPLLFEVTNEKTENKMYLFGSIHVGDPSMYPLPTYVMDAYQKSDILAVEFDLVAFESDFSGQMQALSQLVNPEGGKITEYLDQSLYERAVEKLKEKDLYSPLYDRYLPIMWYSLLDNATYLDAELDSKYGIDRTFLTYAKEDQKEILELESAESQYLMLANFDIELQIYLLEQSLDQYELSISSLKKLYELYQKGDQKALEGVLFEEETSNEMMNDYHQQLITKRNQDMLAVLDAAFQRKENVFCTVGLAHIIGEKGLVRLLEQAGYSVRVVRGEF